MGQRNVSKFGDTEEPIWKDTGVPKPAGFWDIRVRIWGQIDSGGSPKHPKPQTLPSAPPPSPRALPAAIRRPRILPRPPKRLSPIPGVPRSPRGRREGGGAAGGGGWRRIPAAASLTPDTAILGSADRERAAAAKRGRGSGDGATARQCRAVRGSDGRRRGCRGNREGI